MQQKSVGATVSNSYPNIAPLIALLAAASGCAAPISDGEVPDVAAAEVSLGECRSFTSTVAAHVAAGRAYRSRLTFRYYATGSRDALGGISWATVTLREDPTGYFSVGTECPACVPSAETCDGADNDCDGLIDDGVTNACGQCGAVPAETCDGIDNDCDGSVDEGRVCGVPACVAHTATVEQHVSAGRAYARRLFFTTRYYAVGSGAALGSSKAAVVTLREKPAGYFSVGDPCPCAPTGAELCDGLDNDCNGNVDDSYLCMPAETAPAIDELVTQCPPAHVLDAIDTDLDIRFEFTGDLTGQGLVCRAALGSRDMNRFQERVYQGLIALRALEFSNTLPWTDKNLYEWLVDTIDGIRLRTDITTNFCCDPPAGLSGNYLNLVASTDRSFLATDLWFNNNQDGLHSLVQLILHEARHAQNKPHTCGTANDQTLEELGSWSTVYHFYDALAFDSEPCFMRPTLPADNAFPGQLFGVADYLTGMRDLSYETLQTRICAPTIMVPSPPEPVVACEL